ncbi:cystine/glutamate transporter-like [Acanthaster planci]|uniref:Cystine/glutamate transporter-like n=1 Tax=Acanthaster planci TaxID=133434 RepID=A0A8B7Y1Y9_ACAPL|nr:cystine/glutamate transporter-like [Acanthaster planci]
MVPSTKGQRGRVTTVGDDGSSHSIISSLSSSSLVRLRRTITLFSGVCINLGIIIGSGIFVSPKGVLEGAGSVGLTLVLWSACGVFSLLGALCFAELGTTYPTSGAVYTYLRIIYGDLVAFLYLWISVLMAMPSFFAILALTLGDYCLQPVFPDPDCPPPRLVVQLVGTAAMLLLGLVNTVSTRLSTFVQNLFSICKVIALAIIIIAGLVQLIKGQTKHFQNAFEGSTFSGLGFALYAGLYSYTGWESLNYVAEELKNPIKNLPRAIFISVTVVTTLYVFTNVAYFTAIAPEELLASNAVAVTFGDKLLGGFALVMPICVALSMIGSINGNIIICSRMLFVGAREKHVPSVLSMIHIKFLTPLPAIVVMLVLSMCYAFSSDIYTLINFFSFVAWTSIGAAVAGLVWKRWREPDIPRPYKINIVVPILFVLAAIFLVVMGTIDSPIDTAIGVGITLTGLPVYLVFVYPKRLPSWLIEFEGRVTRILQMTLQVVPEETKE